MKKTWWKVPLYCIAASWVCFQLTVHVFGRWALATLPDGTITADRTRELILHAALFAAVVLIGGLLFFRKMSRREIFQSASVLVVLNVVLGIFTYLTQRIFTSFTMLWSILTEWDSIFALLLFQLGVNEWVNAAILWLLPPYIFVLFGRRCASEEQ